MITRWPLVSHADPQRFEGEHRPVTSFHPLITENALTSAKHHENHALSQFKRIDRQVDLRMAGVF